MIKKFRFFIDVFCLLFAAFTFSACTTFQSNLQVAIDSGWLKGEMEDNVASFKGIPYAAAPVGELRWRPPQPIKSWRGIRKAFDYGPFCAQPNSSALGFKLGRIHEDCLMLNVWTPDLTPHTKMPVMVWIHGGGYSQGSGNLARLNSSALAKEGIVLVTINYRLALFGFMAHQAILDSHPEDPKGNYGVLDTIASLEWVKRNIGAFGGDPENVTIFGESAGAGLVNTLMISPRAKDLFHRAISQSSSVGLALNQTVDRRMGFRPSGLKASESFVKNLNLPETDDLASALRLLSTEELLAGLRVSDRFTPLVDGDVVPAQPALLFANGKQHQVPYITGGVSWEASLGRAIGGGFSPETAAKLIPTSDKLRLYPGLLGEPLEDAIFGDLLALSPSQYLAESISRFNPSVYRFYFSYLAEDRRERQPGVAHTDDIAFVMQTLDKETDLETITDRDWEISKLISGYWVQFAKTGNPNRDGLPDWPVFSQTKPQTLEIGDEIRAHNDFLGDRMDYHIKRGLDAVLNIQNQ
ncbi:MAG: carboxylesterase family protein [Pseudomonadota bacterium]|nr:carboxylesterase family protein [Pseudomonadota bacterium]